MEIINGIGAFSIGVLFIISSEKFAKEIVKQNEKAFRQHKFSIRIMFLIIGVGGLCAGIKILFFGG